MGNDHHISQASEAISGNSISAPPIGLASENLERKDLKLATISSDEIVSSFIVSKKFERIWDLAKRSKQQEPLMDFKDVDHILKWDDDMFLICYLKVTITKVIYTHFSEKIVKITRVFTPEESDELTQISSMTKVSDDLVCAADSTIGKMFFISISEREIKRIVDSHTQNSQLFVLKSKGLGDCIFFNSEIKDEKNENSLRLYDHNTDEVVFEESLVPKSGGKKEIEETEGTLEFLCSYLTNEYDEVVVVGGPHFGFLFYNITDFLTDYKDKKRKGKFFCFLRTNFYSPCIHVFSLSKIMVAFGTKFQPIKGKGFGGVESPSSVGADIANKLFFFQIRGLDFVVDEKKKKKQQQPKTKIVLLRELLVLEDDVGKEGHFSTSKETLSSFVPVRVCDEITVGGEKEEEGEEGGEGEDDDVNVTDLFFRKKMERRMEEEASLYLSYRIPEEKKDGKVTYTFKRSTFGYRNEETHFLSSFKED